MDRTLRPKAGGIRTDLPNVYPRGVNTATEWEYFEPLYPGDRLSGNWKLIEIKPRKTARLGEGVFLTVETSIYKQSGELVAKNRNTGFRYPDRQDDAPREKREKPAPAETSAGNEPTMEPADWRQQLRFRRCLGRRRGAALFDVAQLSAYRDECRGRSHVVADPSRPRSRESRRLRRHHLQHAQL